MIRRLALIDLDGVLADDRHRVQYAISRDWGTYFGLMHLDDVWQQGRDLYENVPLAGFDELAYCTGRRDDTRHTTRKWLKKAGFDHKAELIMRDTEDRRRLAEVKADVVGQRLRDYDEVWMFDDDPEVISEVSKVERGVGYHCTWYIKPTRMVKKATT